METRDRFIAIALLGVVGWLLVTINKRPYVQKLLSRGKELLRSLEDRRRDRDKWGPLEWFFVSSLVLAPAVLFQLDNLLANLELRSGDRWGFLRFLSKLVANSYMAMLYGVLLYLSWRPLTYRTFRNGMTFLFLIMVGFILAAMVNSSLPNIANLSILNLIFSIFGVILFLTTARRIFKFQFSRVDEPSGIGRPFSVADAMIAVTSLSLLCAAHGLALEMFKAEMGNMPDMPDMPDMPLSNFASLMLFLSYQLLLTTVAIVAFTAWRTLRWRTIVTLSLISISAIGLTSFIQVLEVSQLISDQEDFKLAAFRQSQQWDAWISAMWEFGYELAGYLITFFALRICFLSIGLKVTRAAPAQEAAQEAVCGTAP